MLSDERRRRLDDWARAVVPRAVAYARSLLRDRSQAEDVVQECLYRLLRRAGEYDLERDGVKLLFRAVSNLCINTTTRGRNLLSLSPADDDAPGGGHADPAAFPPEAFAARRELADALAKAMDALPELQRAALELRALGQGKAEIAEILQVTPTHAGVLVFRARQAVAGALAPFLEG